MYENKLLQLRKRLMAEYLLYKHGQISQGEYCLRVKPIDKAIDECEMSTLQDILVWKESFSPHSHKLKS